MLRNRGRAVVLGSGGTMELGSGGGAKVLSSGGTMELKSGGRTVVLGSDVELGGDFVRRLGGDIAEVASGGGPACIQGQGGTLTGPLLSRHCTREARWHSRPGSSGIRGYQRRGPLG